MANQIVEEARVRIREIEKALAGHDRLVQEKEKLQELLAFYRAGQSTDDARAKQQQEFRAGVGRSLLFHSRPAGPTERILDVLRENPGLTYSEVVNQAAQGLESTADDPKKSAASTLQSLVTRKRVVRRDGKHFLAEGVN